MKRIGIYAGTFDPVHAGHIAFALQARETAKLDKIYFVPERRPRGKVGVEHFGHRVAMLKRALKPYRSFDVLELVDVEFTVARTLPRLQKQFGGSRLVFLFGSDVTESLARWPQHETLLQQAELAIGVRNSHTAEAVGAAAAAWPAQPPALHIVQSFAPDISSSQVRRALYNRVPAKGLLSSVKRYSDRHWLYVSLA